MAKLVRNIRVVNNGPCPIKAIDEFNRRIAEILLMKFSRETIEKVIIEYEKSKEKIG